MPASNDSNISKTIDLAWDVPKNNRTPTPAEDEFIFGGTEKKFVEQVAPNYIAPADDYEIWVSDALQGLYWQHSGRAVPWDTIVATIGSQIPLDRLIKILGSKTFFARMQSRGINWLENWTIDGYNSAVKRDRLTPQQVAAMAAVTDPTDRRALKTKLAAVGITYNKWRSWLSDPSFADVFKEVSENILKDNIGTVHTRLVQKAENGDTNAMKLFYEVSGRHDPNRQQMLDFTKVLALMLEVLQRHITNPTILLNITQDLDKIMNGKAIGNLKELPANYEEIVDAEVITTEVITVGEDESVPPGFFEP